MVLHFQFFKDAAFYSLNPFKWVQTDFSLTAGRHSSYTLPILAQESTQKVVGPGFLGTGNGVHCLDFA